MAVQEAPLPIDVTDIQFKLHSKYQLFETNLAPAYSNGLDLLATASAFGLIITGHPLSPELQIIQLSDVIEKKDGSNVPRRQIQLPSPPQMLSLSCDHSMLAVTYTLNGPAFIDFYAVQSFLSNNVKCLLQKVHVSRDSNVKVKQILWNPVIANTVAVCLDDGTLGMYVLNETSFEYFALDKSNEVRCASWSPKGKQIVIAFPNGKLAQYKPDLKLAKTIPIAAQLFSGPFDPIAVQWLSTYQFAVVFLQKKEEAGPMLYIINAPKNAQPTYINYDDICYGQPGPRASQVFLIHILQWNLILMGSANSTELGILGTNETGETPAWKQYIFLDEARAELPLTADKQDTFPIGVVLETGSTHHLTIGENQIPVMPMVHILSTHGLLLSFNLLNFQPTAVSICSPPQPIADRSGVHLYKEFSAEPKTPVSDQQQQQMQQAAQRPQLPKPQSLFQTPSSAEAPSGNMTFVIPENATSTPAKPPPTSALQTKSLFAAPESKTSSSGILGTGAAPSFGNSNAFGSSGFGGAAFGQNANVAKEPPKSAAVAQVTQRAETTAKPFLTVDSNYTPPTQSAAAANATASSSNNVNASSSGENDEILRKMIAEEIQSFETTIRSSLEKSKSINVEVCTKEECSQLLKTVADLQDVTTQAIRSTEDLSSEIQALRLTLYEAFAMSAEAQSKVDLLNNPNRHQGQEENVIINQAHRRQLNKLENMLTQNQARFDIVSKQIDAHWSSHMEIRNENNRARMRIPNLENVYLTMEKQQQILMREKMHINEIKNKIGMHERGETPLKIKYSFSNPDNLKPSIIDSVLSMTISDQISAERKPLDSRKLARLREQLANRPVRTVQPSRPDRIGLSSEVVIEKKLAYAKEQKKKEKIAAAAEIRHPVPAKPAAQAVVVTPPATKPLNVTPQPAPVSKPTAVSFPSINTVPNNAVVSTPASQLPKPPFGTTFSLSSRATVASTTPTPSSVTITAVPPMTSNASPSPMPFAVNKSQSQTSFTFNPAPTKPLIEKPPLITKVEPAKVDKPVFSFTSSVKPSTEKVEAEKPTAQAPLIGNKENLPSEKPNSAFNFAPEPLAAPKSTSSATIPVQKPLTIFGQAANSMPIFGAQATAPAAKEATEKVSIATESPSIVKALLSTPASTKPTTSVASPATSFVFSSSSTPNVSVQSIKPAVSVTPINLVKTSEAPKAAPATAVTSAITSPVTSFSFANSTTPAQIFSKPDAAKSTVAQPDAASIFKGFGISSTANTGAVTSTSSPFASSVFGTPAPAPVTSAAATPTIVAVKSLANEAKPNVAVASPTSPFGFASAAANSTAASIFSGFGTPSTATSTIAPTPPSTTASSDVGSIFKDFSICKPNVSGNANSSGGGIFSGNAFGTSNAFTSQTSSAPSIFGNAATSPPPAAQAASIFGGNATQTTPSAANIFGGNANTPTAAAAPASNIFGSPSGGSGIFSSAPAAANTGFANASPFGNQSNQQPTGGSLFGSGFGGGFAQAASNPPSVFGSQSAFGSQPNNASFGSPSGTSGFGQGQTIAQTGFGSPTSASAFGLSAAAAAQPVFGQTPAFGQTATFGSPKSGFGTFSGTNNAFASTTPQKNSLFESLGSSENAMTFGNLAQAQAAPPPAAKPFGGGSSFSSWR